RPLKARPCGVRTRRAPGATRRTRHRRQRAARVRQSRPRDRRRSGARMSRETDIVIVGAGTAGATLAGLLLAHGHARVTLLEAGPDYGPLSDGRWPADLLDPRYIPISHDWQLSTRVRPSAPPPQLPP